MKHFVRLREKGTRAVFLLPVLLIPMGMIGIGAIAGSDSTLAAIVSALKTPMNLLTDGSPGARAPGVLLSIKPNFGSHERVLSQEREREAMPLASALPPAELPTDTSPENGIAPNDQRGSPSPSNFSFGTGGVPGGSLAYPGFSSFGFGDSAAPSAIPPLGMISIPEIQSGSDSATPIDQSFAPPSEASIPPEYGSTGVTPVNTQVPEPSTWSLVLLGLIIIVTTLRRGARNRSVQTSANS